MVIFQLIDNEALLHAESAEDEYVVFEGSYVDWENSYDVIVYGNEQEKLKCIREWAEECLDCYLKVIG